MKRRMRFVGWAVVAALVCGMAGGPADAAVEDAESASHAYGAAFYQVVDTYEYPGFKVVQFNLPVLSHYSYLLISGREALLIDPGRDVYAYLDMIRKDGLDLKGVFLTHSHADFVAGHMEMVNALKRPIYQSEKCGAGYPFEPLKDGSTLTIGEARMEFVDTPGHVLDGTSAYVYGTARGTEPDVMFSGDYLFVGSVGRPDLVAGTTAEALASAIYDTWVNKVSKLPDRTVVFPAHGAGSLCGAHLRDEPFTTIGTERASNPYLQHKGKGEFVTAVLGSLSEPPQYFGHNAAMNRAGPALTDWAAPLPEALVPDESLTDPARHYLVDLRTQEDYAAGHMPRAVNIGLRGRLETWVGIMVPWGSSLVLCGDEAELGEAVYRLHRVGYSGGVVSMDAWQKAGLPVAKNEMTDPKALYRLMQSGQAPVIVDVRLPEEWMGLRIGTVLNLPLNRLEELSAKLTPTEPVVTVCNSAYRSSMAVGVLERKGFTRASSLAGGSEAWVAAGLPTYGADAGSAAAPAAAATRDLGLPERISAAELKRLLMDLPGTFDLVDIRPAAMYADFHVPGSRNADIADVLGNAAYLTGAGPLIIVDRDGSLAMAVAGILSQKTKRPVRALYGGVEAYWAESELKPIGSPTPIGAPVPAASASVPPVSPSASPVPAGPSAGADAPQAPKQKSAGC